MSSFLNGALFACFALCSFGGTALALDPGQSVSEYIRDHWGPEKGFPGGSVYAIAQTTDGYLWIGAEAGLFRFDGLNFALLQAPDSQGLAIHHVLGLIADRDGSLWLRLAGPTLVHYSDGVFTVVSPDPKNPEPMVTAMVLSRDSRPLVSSRLSGIAVLQGPAFEPLAPETLLPRSAVVSIAQTANGEIWLGTLDKGLIRVRGETVSIVSLGRREPKINCLLPDADGQLWIGADRGLVKWNGSAIVAPILPAPFAHDAILSLSRDRDSNVWAGTAASGALRLNAAGVSAVEQSGQPSPVAAVFEDREGNIWMGTGNGIDRLRESFFVNYSEAAGLPSDGNGSIYADARGTIWWAPASGGLYSLTNGKATRITQAGLDNEVIYSISGGDGELWLGRQYGGLTHLHWPNGSLRTETYTRKNGLAQDTVYVAEENRDGSVWAGTVNAGASLFRNGEFRSYVSADGLAANIVTSILETSSGATWFAGPSGLSVLTQGSWRVFRTSDGLPSVVTNSLYEDSSGVIWIGTMHGIASSVPAESQSR